MIITLKTLKYTFKNNIAGRNMLEYCIIPIQNLLIHYQ